MHLSDIQARLKQIGTRSDDRIPLLETLLLLGVMNWQDIDLDSYRAHGEELHHALAIEIETHPIKPDEAILQWRLARLHAVLVEQFGYHPDVDQDNYDDPDKVNLLDIIDRRSGVPVALGVLYMDLAERQKWPVTGLNFPGHFLMRFDEGSQRHIIDPFHPNEVMDAGKLRQLLKNTLGPKAELHHDYYSPVTHRDIILRFCNKRKTRQITHEDYIGALQTITHELWIAPNEPRLLYEMAVICIKLQRFTQALENLQNFVQLSNDAQSISEAHAMIRALQRRLS